jgi:mRNA interferase MazF
MVGKIYLATIYFTDFSEYKVRPVLIIKHIEQDCICLPLTSKMHRDGIVITNNDLLDGFLKKDSLVVFPKNITLHTSLLLRHIATLSPGKMRDIFMMFCQKIGCTAHL